METKHKIILTTAIIFGFGLMVSVPAQARNLRGACKADIEKVCKDVKPGEGRIADCLKDNIKKISKDCKERIES
ncbi:MAG: cysteine rich repeat-containing protein, partial [Elusimicrobiota bacterium]|nr:cysteine rich repeat-containing protein [Elusimicrobiota bacterium]